MQKVGTSDQSAADASAVEDGVIDLRGKGREETGQQSCKMGTTDAFSGRSSKKGFGGSSSSAGGYLPQRQDFQPRAGSEQLDLAMAQEKHPSGFHRDAGQEMVTGLFRPGDQVALQDRAIPAQSKSGLDMTNEKEKQECLTADDDPMGNQEWHAPAASEERSKRKNCRVM